jgi:hypothetical protein
MPDLAEMVLGGGQRTLKRDSLVKFPVVNRSLNPNLTAKAMVLNSVGIA